MSACASVAGQNIALARDSYPGDVARQRCSNHPNRILATGTSIDRCAQPGTAFHRIEPERHVQAGLSRREFTLAPQTVGTRTSELTTSTERTSCIASVVHSSVQRENELSSAAYLLAMAQLRSRRCLSKQSLRPTSEDLCGQAFQS